MGIPIPIFSDLSGLTDAITGPGKYRARWKMKSWLLGQPFAVGDTRGVGESYVMKITKVEEDRANDKLYIEFEVSELAGQTKEANIGAGAILITLGIIAGLALVYMSLEKVDRIVESPGGQVAIVGGGILIVAIIVGALIFYFKLLKK